MSDPTPDGGRRALAMTLDYLVRDAGRRHWTRSIRSAEATLGRWVIDNHETILTALRQPDPGASSATGGGDAGARQMRGLLTAAWPVDSAIRRLPPETADQILITPAMSITVGDLRTMLKAIRRAALPDTSRVDADGTPHQGDAGEAR